jgi:hypothetical protein
MKHLLIILSFLLLSSPVIGQETGVLYLYETSSGLVWKTFGDDKVQPKYKGEIKNGKPEGFGNLTSSDGEKYVGEWKDGKKYGQGTNIYHHGFKYVGEWKDNKKNGRGRLTKPNGLEEFGEFKNGKLHGEGKVTTPKGRKIVGEFKDYKPWNVTVYDKDGKTLGKMVDGKRQ